MMTQNNQLDSDIWDKVSNMILPVGTDQFEPLFYKTCRSLFANDQCNIFLFRGGLDSSPYCALTTASEKKMRNLTRDLSHEYVEKGFKSDPTLDWARSRGLKQRSRHIRVLSARQVGDQHYRHRFYDHALVRQKLTMLAPSDTSVLYVNFYRNPDQKDFGAEERNRLELVGGALGNLLKKHIELSTGQTNEATVPSSELSPEYRERLRDRVRHMLLNEGTGLTPREADICSSVAIGMTTEGIGLTFGISSNTVATHRKRAYAKMGISSQSELFARYHDALAQQIRRLR